MRTWWRPQRCRPADAARRLLLMLLRQLPVQGAGCLCLSSCLAHLLVG